MVGVVCEHLHGDLVGTGLVKLADAAGHGLRVAPSDHGVDQAVAAATGQVLLGEAEPAQVGRVAPLTQVEAEGLAGDGAGPAGVRRPRWLALGGCGPPW